MPRPFRLLASTLAVLASAAGATAVPALTTSTALLGTGCTCTLMYVEGGAAVSLTLTDPSGNYHVEVTGMGETLTATITPQTPGTCPGCSTQGERLLLELTRPQPSGPTLLTARVRDLTGQGEPERFTLRVYRNDELRLERELTPSYQTDEPNGPGCGEVATASVALTVP